MSRVPRICTQPDDPINLHLLAIKQNYRRSSAGNCLSPCQEIDSPNLLLLGLPSAMDEQNSRNRSRSLSPGGVERLSRASSEMSGDMPLTQIHQTFSRSRSSSSSSSESSDDDCSEQIAALESLIVELQETKRDMEKDEDAISLIADAMEVSDVTVVQDFPAHKEGLASEPCTPSDPALSRLERLAHSPLKHGSSLDLPMLDKKKRIEEMEEKEKILSECRNQIKTLLAANKSLERNVLELKDDLTKAQCYRIPSRTELKCWPRTRACVQDLDQKLSLDDNYVDPSEIMAVLLESEKRYVSALTLLNSHYRQPMHILASFKPEILSMQQLNTLFLNCNELLVIHRALYEDLQQVPSLPEAAQVDKLFEILERTFLAFGHYSSYLAGNRQQNIQKELRQLKGKPQFEQLLNHCQQNCEGMGLNKLLTMPAERMGEYSELLTHFLNPRVRALPEDASRRAKTLIKFLSNIRYSLSDDKSEWDHAQEKIKLLNKLAMDGLIPMEVFNSDVRLMKQGPLTQVVGKKELPRHCILFNNYICLATTKDTTQIKIMESGMMSLFGAQLHRCVDVEGQAIGSDLQSGLSEDKLAFRLSLLNNEPLYLRAAKPSEWRQWLDVLEKCIQESRELQMELETDILDHRQLYAVDAGPKIAAASLEKLFQQLTSPQFELRPDFLRVFLLTHSCFTTPMDVLTALLNCIKTPEDMADRLSQVSESELFFDMQMEDATGSGSVSASASSYTINTTDSEIGSPGHSPSVVRRSTSSSGQGYINVSPSPSPSTGMLRNPGIARKAVHSATSFISTSDSDVSPHTSAIVVDNSSISTRDGWAESGGDGDIEFKKRPGVASTLPLRIVTSDYSTCSSVASEGYTKLYPRSRDGLVMTADSDGSDQEEEREGQDEGTKTPEDSLMGTGRVRIKTYRSMSEGSNNVLKISVSDDDTARDHEQDDSEDKEKLGRSERMQLDLDEASKMMELSLSLCNSVFDEPSVRVQESAKDHTLTRHSKLDASESSKRLTVLSSLSSSQPDLNTLSIDDDMPPPLPPRDSGMLDVLSQSVRGYLQPETSNLVRSGSEHSLMTQSVSLSGSGSRSSFQSDIKLCSGMQQFRRGSLNPSVDKSALSKSPSRKSDKNIFRSKKAKKKADTFSGRSSNSIASPARSATMMFSQSPTHSSALTSSMTLGGGAAGPCNSGRLNLSASFNASDTKAKKSKWKMLQSKMGRKFQKTNIVEEEGLPQSPARTQRSNSTPSMKKYGVNRSFSINEEDGRRIDRGSMSGVISPRSRRTSTSQTCSLKVLTKVFNILNVWVADYFEDFESDADLTKTLRDALENLISRSTFENLEYHQAHQLCSALSLRAGSFSTPPPNCPFQELLGWVLNIKPEVLKMFDWENPDKLMKGREIDLSKNIPSQGIRMIAEQLTLMEFSVYAAIQRRELLNCNWKKTDKEKLAPNVCRLIRRTNDMTCWVSTEILQRKTPSQRATVIEHFIEIANTCYKHNDLHCALNITIALGSACIRSLRLTWAEVNRKHKHRFEKLKDAMDYHGRCKKMRENLEQLAQDTINKTGKLPSALPYIGAYLDTIYSLEIASKTYNKNGLVNFTKMTKLAEIVSMALQYQRVGFGFEVRLEIMAYVTAAKRDSENDLYERSMTVEPPSS